jgi:hypothetical protein
MALRMRVTSVMGSKVTGRRAAGKMRRVVARSYGVKRGIVAARMVELNQSLQQTGGHYAVPGFTLQAPDC